MNRPIRQHILALKAQIKGRHLTADQAGAKLASYLKKDWPEIADALLTQACTTRFRKCTVVPEGWAQASLWPVNLWQEPLFRAITHHEEQCAFTGRMAARDLARGDDLDKLKAAVNGDLTKTLEEAYQLAFPDAEEAV